MTDMRDKLAEELALHFNEPKGQLLSAADDIIAALPHLIGKAEKDAAFDAMWKLATETYSLEATNENGARYSITGDVINALYYAAILVALGVNT